jgi:hypothetical protein
MLLTEYGCMFRVGVGICIAFTLRPGVYTLRCSVALPGDLVTLWTTGTLIAETERPAE